MLVAVQPRTFLIPHLSTLTFRIYKTVILLVALYKCEEHRLRGFENRVLRRIFGPEGDEVTGD
jgi:hypothetical protein